VSAGVGKKLKNRKAMTITIITILIVSAVIILAFYATRIRKKSIRDFNRRYTSHYVIKHLTQQTFNKAVNIVMDLVKSDGADIEVTYKDQVIFNGYMDIEAETGKDTPHFWYNKEVLDRYGIDYRY
jgi:hypothetical protein